MRGLPTKEVTEKRWFLGTLGTYLNETASLELHTKGLSIPKLLTRWEAQTPDLGPQSHKTGNNNSSSNSIKDKDRKQIMI